MLRIDKEATKQAQFLDKRSYVGNRIFAHPGTNHQCVYLFGKDASLRRHYVVLLQGGKCKCCGQSCIAGSSELDHIVGGSKVNRCWCFENLQYLCRECHTKKHGRYPRFGEAK